MIKLTQVERMALLKCRTAARFREAWEGKPNATEAEALEEQRAQLATIPQAVYRKLARFGLIMTGPARLTDEGRRALAEATDTKMEEGEEPR